VPAIKEFHALKASGIKPEKLLLVLNRIATPSEAAAAQEFCQASGYRSLPTFLYEKASYRQVQNEGKSLAEVSYKNLRCQVKLLITDLLKYI
jgi:Flp pilus assembly CpaE family ATPase